MTSAGLHSSFKQFMSGLVALGCLLSPVAAQHLVIESGNQTLQIPIRTDPAPLYRLLPITALLDLAVDEQEARLTISGPRGRLLLTAGRPLVQFRDQYILISSPIYREAPGAWFVAEDFLTKALPLILLDRIERRAPRHYRIETLERNRVAVQVVEYPDHVSVVFLPERDGPVRVREVSGGIRVEFDRYLVTPALPETSPDSEIFDVIEFEPDHVFGAFNISKGPQYGSFREYDLSDPPRRIVDLYSLPPVLNDPAGEVTPDDQPAPLTQTAPEFRRTRKENVVVIDPGHGGDDLGVQTSVEVFEKDFNLQLAERVAALLRGTRFEPVLTRDHDRFLSTDERSSQTNHLQPRIFVSIHQGASLNPRESGGIVYVQPLTGAVQSEESGLARWEGGQQSHIRDSRLLAQLIQARLNRLGRTSHRVTEAPLALLAPVSAPAVVVETAFLSNAEDLENLADPDYQDLLARAIVQSLLEFLE